MANSNRTQTLETLAAEIGENIYIDVAKWHLYLADAHLHTQVAEGVYPLLEEGNLDENEIVDILQAISVKLGGGKRQLPLSDLIPQQSQANLLELLEEFQKNL